MKISTKRTKGILCLIGVLFLLAPPAVLAQDDLMLMMIPAVSGSRPLKNVITVAKANGKFTDPVAAVNSISDASVDNPYLVVIGPGVYTITQTLVMKPFVDIAGSGANVTKIKGAISTGSAATSAIISGASYSALSSLTVENNGGSTYSIALYNSHVNYATVSNVTARANNGTQSRAVFNENAYITMTNITTHVVNGVTQIGVHNTDTSIVKITNLYAYTYGGTNNFGVYNVASGGCWLTDVTTNVYGGVNNYGVYNNSSNIRMTGVHAEGIGGTGNNYGVYNDSSYPKILRSTMNGSIGLYSTGGTTIVSQSTILGGVSGAGTKKCVGCDDGNGNALNKDCLVIP